MPIKSPGVLPGAGPKSCAVAFTEGAALCIRHRNLPIGQVLALFLSSVAGRPLQRKE
jgi:hypothetical protein